MKNKFSAYILTEDQKKILQYIQELSKSKYSNFKTQLEMSKEIGISRARVNVSLNFLCEKGILEKKKHNSRFEYKIKE